MALKYWGLNRGEHETDVVVQATTPAKNVEVKVDIASNITREEAHQAIDYIFNVMLKGNWPPS